jgi:exopolysaccharide production protein ExoZ
VDYLWVLFSGRQKDKKSLKYNSLQYLRAIAVLSVLVLHSHILFPVTLAKVPILSDFGWIGVRLFFVISGFIIAERISTCRSLGDYLTRRVLRVFPLYFTFTMIAVTFALSTDYFPYTLIKTDSGALFDPFLPVYLLKSMFIFPQDEWPIIAVGWSLEFELVFYALFGVAYFTVSSIGARLVILGLATVGLLNLVPGNQIVHPFLFYFLAGCLCRDGYHSFSGTLYLGACFVILPSTFIWLAHLYGGINVGSNGFVVASGVSFSALLVLFLRLEPRLSHFPGGAKIVLIGDASFSIYLVHWLLFCTVHVLMTDITMRPVYAEALRWTIIAGSVFLSILVHRRIEGPLNHWSLNLAGRMQAGVSSRWSRDGR